MNKLSIKRGLKFFHTLVLHIPMVESYRKLSSIDLVWGFVMSYMDGVLKCSEMGHRDEELR